MIYKFLADSVVVFHFVFIIFALLGGLLILWRNWFVFVHLPAAIWIALIEFLGWVCPLTPLENHLLNLSGNSAYQVGFVEYYLLPIIYPAGLTHHAQAILAWLAALVNVGVYAIVYWRKKRTNKPSFNGNKL